MFRRHVQESCQHEARVPVIVCRICHLKSTRYPKKNTKTHDSNSAEVQIESGNSVHNNIDSPLKQSDDKTYIPESLIDYRSVISHLYQNHITLVYRCTSCPRAFLKKEAIYDHRVKEHDGDLTHIEEKKKGDSVNTFYFFSPYDGII